MQQHTEYWIAQIRGKLGSYLDYDWGPVSVYNVQYKLLHVHDVAVHTLNFALKYTQKKLL